MGRHRTATAPLLLKVGGAVTVQILLGDRGVTKVLELYEENSMLPDD